MASLLVEPALPAGNKMERANRGAIARMRSRNFDEMREAGPRKRKPRGAFASRGFLRTNNGEVV
jgi:hypothetical protein